MRITRTARRTGLSLAGLSLAGLLPAATAAQGYPRPRPGAPKAFVVPARTDFTLPNGLRVTLVPFGNTPLARVVLAVRAGTIDEDADAPGIADVVAEMLQQGTASRSAGEIARAVSGMGAFFGALEATVSATETQLGATVLAEFAPELVRLVADVATRPALPADALARIATNRRRTLAAQRGQPAGAAAAKVAAVLYPDHPYGRAATDSTVAAYTIERVRRFHGEHFAAARAHLYVAGMIEPAALERAIRDAFAGWSRGEADTPEFPRLATAGGIYLIDRPGAAQARLHLTAPIVDPPHPDHIPFVVTDALLGRQGNSRIPRSVREAKGYSYNIISRIVTRPGASVWNLTGDVATPVVGAAVAEVLREIERLRTETPPIEELRGFQNFTAGRFIVLNSTAGDIIQNLQMVDTYGLGPDYLSTYIDRVYAVTPDDVRRMARTYLSAERMPLVLVGDRKAVADQVAPHGHVVP
ncbi:MAG: pitrilysin family protein [Gemmatimonadaceae bacterium]